MQLPSEHKYFEIRRIPYLCAQNRNPNKKLCFPFYKTQRLCKDFIRFLNAFSSKNCLRIFAETIVNTNYFFTISEKLETKPAMF